MDRFSEMRSLITVARTSSFSGAAHELGVSASLVSKHVAELERQLGVSLVSRTSRSTTLTEPGRRYAAFSQRILDEIDEEEDELRHERDLATGSLSILCPKWIGTLEITDAIAAFSIAHPQITLRLELESLSSRTYDFIDRGFDVAFHARELRDSSVHLRRITVLPFVLAASRTYLDRRGRPERISDLAAHACLQHSNDAVWQLQDHVRSTQHRVSTPTIASNSYIAIARLVRAGCGIALVPRHAVQDDLDLGSVEQVLPGVTPATRTLFAVHAPGQVPARVRMFLDFTIEWFRANTRDPATAHHDASRGTDDPSGEEMSRDAGLGC